MLCNCQNNTSKYLKQLYFEATENQDKTRFVWRNQSRIFCCIFGWYENSKITFISVPNYISAQKNQTWVMTLNYAWRFMRRDSEARIIMWNCHHTTSNTLNNFPSLSMHCQNLSLRAGQPKQLSFGKNINFECCLELL